MNELEALKAELDRTPPALEGCVARARRRYRRSRTGRACGFSLASLAGVAAAFVLLVNLSLPFARACGGVPILKDLAAAAALSPSLKAAVENRYVQPVRQSRTANGVTMTVEYLIVDQKQVNIFYTLSGGDPSSFWEWPRVRSLTGEVFPGCEIYLPSDNDPVLRRATVYFFDNDVPAALTFQLRVFDRAGLEGDPPVLTLEGLDGEVTDLPLLADFSFDLTFDPAYTAAGEIYPLDRSIELDGQTLTVSNVEVYPTHLRLNLADHPSNTAWLTGLDFYVTDEKGNRYDHIGSGVGGYGIGSTPFVSSHWLESTYFGGAKHLTAHITGAEWVLKEEPAVRIDLEDGVSVTGLPEGVLLGGLARRGEDVVLTLFAPDVPAGSGRPVLDGSSSVIRYLPSDPTAGFDGAYQVLSDPPEGYYAREIVISGHDWTAARVALRFRGSTAFEVPVDVPIY